MSTFYELLTTLLVLSFIFKVNSFLILFESLPCYTTYPYTGVIQNILLLSFATLFLTDWVTLKEYIELRFLYKALPWIGLIYMGAYDLWNHKSVGDMSFELGWLIMFCCCLLLLFRLLKLVSLLLWQKLVQHLSLREVEMTSDIQQQQQQQQRADDPLMKEISFISKLREGGIMPWRGFKLAILCMVNGSAMVGSLELVLDSNCILSFAVAIIMLTTGVISFSLFSSCQYVFEEWQGEVLPPPALPPV